MSRPNGDSDDADDASTADADWFDRHARVERHTSDRCVRADPPSDDWEARHSRTSRRD